jgi:hypothetical protein
MYVQYPDGFHSYRNDRNLNGGGVLIAVKDTYITSSVPELQTDCEIVWCKMEIVGHKTFYISAYYNQFTLLVSYRLEIYVQYPDGFHI